jgi:DNA-binding transcriptional LysR family regulator
MLIKSFEYFITVAEGASFFDAASKHNVSQSSFSKVIIKLEGELGVRLFDRSHYPVTLTEAGQQMYADLKELIPGYKKLQSHMKAYKKGRDVSCAVIPCVFDFDLNGIFDKFSNLYPDIPLSLCQASNKRLTLESLQKGDIDFCIMHKPVAPPPPS